jgi:hypothetical protein
MLFVRQNFTCEQNFIYNLVKRSCSAEVFIVHFAILSGENTYKICTLALEFTDGLMDQLTVFKHGCSLHRFTKSIVFVFLSVLVAELVKQEVYLGVLNETRNIAIVRTCGR